MSDMISQLRESSPDDVSLQINITNVKIQLYHNGQLAASRSMTKAIKDGVPYLRQREMCWMEVLLQQEKQESSPLSGVEW